MSVVFGWRCNQDDGSCKCVLLVARDLVDGSLVDKEEELFVVVVVVVVVSVCVVVCAQDRRNVAQNEMNWTVEQESRKRKCVTRDFKGGG